MNNFYDISQPMTLASTLGIYEDLRRQMPQALMGKGERKGRVRDCLDGIEALFLDGFGVLNVGYKAVDGAASLVQEAKASGIQVLVVTNGGSLPSSLSVKKYQNLGIDITADEVISSRDALLTSLGNQGQKIGFISQLAHLPETPLAMQLIPDDKESWLAVDGVAFMGAITWNSTWQACLDYALSKGQNIYIANPDVVAPHPTGFTREPGFWVAKALFELDRSSVWEQVQWFGKPYAPIFTLALSRLQEMHGRVYSPDNILMVGDSLHTDVLGGKAAGFKTALVTDHGLFCTGGSSDAITNTGIVPDFITKTL